MPGVTRAEIHPPPCRVPNEAPQARRTPRSPAPPASRNRRLPGSTTSWERRLPGSAGFQPATGRRGSINPTTSHRERRQRGPAHGLTSLAPVFRKSFTFRVMRAMPRLTAVPVSMASGRCWSSGSPCRRLSSMMRAHAWASATVQSSTRPSKRSSNRNPDYARSSSRSGGLAKAALFPGSRASLPADGARSVAFASLPRAGSPRSQEADGPSCRSPDENCA